MDSLPGEKIGMAELLGYGLPDVWAGSIADSAGRPPDGMIQVLDGWV